MQHTAGHQNAPNFDLALPQNAVQISFNPLIWQR